MFFLAAFASRSSNEQPKAIVFRNGRRFLVDVEGEILADASKRKTTFRLRCIGWDESENGEGDQGQQERVKIYQRMLTEFRRFESCCPKFSPLI